MARPSSDKGLFAGCERYENHGDVRAGAVGGAPRVMHCPPTESSSVHELGGTAELGEAAVKDRVEMRTAG